MGGMMWGRYVAKNPAASKLGDLIPLDGGSLFVRTHTLCDQTHRIALS